MKTEDINKENECPMCNGEGYTMDIEVNIECCGWVDENGSCCNKMIQQQKIVQKMCSFCYNGIVQ